MRAGGLLDGFPLHLLTSADRRGARLVLDAPSLGRLQLAPPDDDAPTLVLSPSLAQLRQTRHASADARLELVCADPARPPFREGAIEGVVRRAEGDLPAVARMDGVRWVVEVESPARTEAGRYVVRPSAGSHYFVTREWLPSRWPFAPLQLGKLKTARMLFELWASRLGLRPLQDSVSLTVRCADGVRPLIDESASAAPASGDGFGLFVKAGWNALLLGAREAGAIVKYPLIPAIAESMQRHAQQLDALHEGAAPGLRDVLPVVSERGEVAGQAYWTETRCDGVPLTKFPWRPAWRRRAVEAGLDFLIDLHRATARPTRVDRERFDALVGPRLASVAAEARVVEPDFDLAAFQAALWRGLEGRELPLVRTHGDFWSGNVLATADARLAGVLDWDASLARGWPALDLLHMLAFRRKHRAYKHFGALVDERFLAERLGRFDREMVSRYFQAMELERDLWPALVSLYWLERLSQWIATDLHELRADPGWVRRNLVRAAPRIVARLDAAYSVAGPGARGVRAS